MVGLGTVINVIAILAGSAIGVGLGSRLKERTRDVVTDGLGLITLLVAAISAAAILDPAIREVLSNGAVLVVLGALIIGGVIGSLARIEERLEGMGDWIQRLFIRRGSARSTDGSVRFVEGFVTASLVFCIGPLAILGSLSDGLGEGIDQLALKSALDFFASIAFAAALGWGVAASAVPVLIVQGIWTAIGFWLGGVLDGAQIAIITATGGLLLVGVSLRLLRIRPIAVADLLPALLVAPVLLWLVEYVINR